MKITFSGIDEWTDLSALTYILGMVAGHHEIEYGILVTVNPEGRNRYPSFEWIDEAIDVLGNQCALHFCGSDTRKRFMRTADFEHWFGVCGAGRLQVNGPLSPGELQDLNRRFGWKPVITQHTPENARHVAVSYRTHQILVDGSGGRGLVPTEWAAPETDKPVGLAGGLSHLTIPTELPKILKVAKPGFWIDMETGVRNQHDRFDISLAQDAIAAVDRVLDRETA